MLLRNRLVKAPLLLFYSGDDYLFTTSNPILHEKDVTIPLEEAQHAFPDLFNPNIHHTVEAYKRRPHGGGVYCAGKIEMPLTSLPPDVIEVVKYLGIQDLVLLDENDTHISGRLRRTDDPHVSHLKRELSTFKTRLRGYENMHHFVEPNQPIQELPGLKNELSPLEAQLAHTLFEKEHDLTEVETTLRSVKGTIDNLIEKYQTITTDIAFLAPQIEFHPYSEQDLPALTPLFKSVFDQQTLRRKNDPRFRAARTHYFNMYFDDVKKELTHHLIGTVDGKPLVSAYVPTTTHTFSLQTTEEAVTLTTPVLHTMNIDGKLLHTHPALKHIHTINPDFLFFLIAQSILHHFENKKAPHLTILDTTRRYENYFLQNGFIHFTDHDTIENKTGHYYYKKF